MTARAVAIWLLIAALIAGAATGETAPAVTGVPLDYVTAPLSMVAAPWPEPDTTIPLAPAVEVRSPRAPPSCL